MPELYNAHVGIVRMKGLERKYFWWPGNNSHTLRNFCEDCIKNVATRSKTVLIKFLNGKHVFDRISINFFDSFKRKLLIIANFYSKWPEVYEMSKLALIIRYPFSFINTLHCVTSQTLSKLTFSRKIKQDLIF